MGQLSLILVVAAFLVGGIMVYNGNQSAARADEKVWEHQYHVIARDAASTGMSRAVRTLAVNLNESWDGDAQTEISALSDQAYGPGTYTVEVSSGDCSSVLTGTNLTTVLTEIFPTYPTTGYVANRDLIEVRSTGSLAGNVMGDEEQSHQIAACYLQADFFNPTPPSFQYSFISNNDFDFNGGPDIQAYLEGYGSVHSNQEMDLGPQVVIDGHATMVDEANSNNQGSVVTFGTGNPIPMVQFDPNEVHAEIGNPTSSIINDDFRYDAASYSIGGGTTTLSPPSGGTRADDPWIWFVDGDLTISGNAHLVLPQWTTIVVTGQLNVQAGANVTVSGTLPPRTNGMSEAEAEAAIRTWINAQLLGGEHAPLAWYVDGDGQRISGTGTEWESTIDDVIIGGGGAMIGNIYTNGDFRLNGGGGGTNLVGSIAAYGDILGNGGGNGNNFWFLEVGQQNIIDGVLLPGKQIVRLALAEWTDPVLDTP